MQGINDKPEKPYIGYYICGGERHKTFKCDIRKDRADETRNGAAISGNSVALVATVVTPVVMATLSDDKNSKNTNTITAAAGE